MFIPEARHVIACDVFKAANVRSINAIVEAATGICCPKGRVIFSQGDPAKEFALVTTGKLGAKWISPEGREVHFHDYAPGDIAGYASVVSRQSRALSCVAVIDSRILKVSGEVLQKVIQSDRQVANQMVRHLASVQLCQTERICEFSVHPVGRRIRLEVLRLAKSAAARKNASAGKPIEIRIPKHQEIANKVITHREAVTRELRKLSSTGAIEAERNTIKILDFNRLKELCEK